MTHHRNNRSTFSDEFATILRDAGAVFASAMDQLLHVANQAPTGNSTIDDYRRFLVSEVPDFEKRSVQVKSLVPKGLLFPFEGMTPTTSPRWWQAYNNVKHSLAQNYTDGNLEHSLHAVAAVSLLAAELGSSGGPYLFNNIGVVLITLSGNEERLFP